MAGGSGARARTAGEASHGNGIENLIAHKIEHLEAEESGLGHKGERLLAVDRKRPNRSFERARRPEYGMVRGIRSFKVVIVSAAKIHVGPSRVDHGIMGTGATINATGHRPRAGVNDLPKT